MARFRRIEHVTRIPVPGGKRIEEIAGRVNTGTSAFSLAHMVAPPGWGEPAQTPTFSELTYVLRGRMRVEVDGEAVDVPAGQAILVEPDTRVRYSNPHAEESEYVALCLPAFSPELARRDAE